jgi:hypothetical protein
VRQTRPTTADWGMPMSAEIRQWRIPRRKVGRSLLGKVSELGWWLGILALCSVPGCLDPLVEDPGANLGVEPQGPVGLPVSPGNAGGPESPIAVGDPVLTPTDPVAPPTSTQPAPTVTSDIVEPAGPTSTASPDQTAGEPQDAGAGDAAAFSIQGAPPTTLTNVSETFASDADASSSLSER